MNLNKYIALFFSIMAFAGYAQEKKYDISAPTDISRTGYNKVLCMKNGNTMLFHLELGKPMVVKVFDSLHKEVASQKCITRAIDESKFKENSLFEGLFEVNGEA